MFWLIGAEATSVFCEREVGMGMFSPTLICASSLSAVRIMGAEMMLMLAFLA